MTLSDCAFWKSNLQFVIYYLSFACNHVFKRYVYWYAPKPTHSFTPFPYCSSPHTFALQSGMFRTLKSSENPSRNLILIWIELSPIFRTWENWELQVKPCLWSMFVIRNRGFLTPLKVNLLFTNLCWIVLRLGKREIIRSWLKSITKRNGFSSARKR